MVNESTADQSATSEALAAIVVANRSFGLFKEEAREAMIELMRRKEDGDSFNYDSYIEKKLAEVPKPDHNSGIQRFIRAASMIGPIGINEQ